MRLSICEMAMSHRNLLCPLLVNICNYLILIWLVILLDSECDL